MIIQYSVAAIALAFIWLVVYLITTLQKGMTTLGEANKTLADVRNAIHDLSDESKQLLRTANEITVDVKSKMKAVDPLLDSAQDVGEAIHAVTNTVKKAATTEFGNNRSPIKINTSRPKTNSR
ncbi:DUF948 domain-containing protein [Peribacillus sp. FSL H8-0477]|uniref:DUF948 domain-containing protein n=1 Tax=Peribacillus sp. FSL H8-0477 TaxID=2921388 RepID=UPI0030F965AD